jgi:endonuclease/exonuclease/phosphatase family metal-dependent hydrolase
VIVYSWNMLYRNRDQRAAFRFIAKSDFDLFCLQEVPEEVLTRLKSLPFYLAYRVDTEKIFPASIVPMYNVILSKHPIEAQGEVAFDDYRARLPLRTRLFLSVMRPFHFAPLGNRGGVYADVRLGDRLVRVFCLHLILATPAARLTEFERAMLARDDKPTIVCGDFNILEKPHITPLNWLMGGRLSDSLRFSRERTTIEQRFVEHQLVNTLRGAITHPLSRSQLDHILVSRSFSIRNATVLPDRVGSDHHPVRVEVA